MSAHPRPRRAAHVLLMLLLVSGLVVRPTLGLLAGLHALDHAGAAATVAADAHAHRHAAAHDHPHAVAHARAHGAGTDAVATAPAVSGDDAGAGGEPDHTAGLHGLLHDGAGPVVALVHAAAPALLPAAPTRDLPVLAPPPVPGDDATLPFRPPIA